MMTRREAHQRAEVYGAYLKHRVNRDTHKLEWAACLLTWDRRAFLAYVHWRGDIEDAVLDCGRLKP